MSGHPLARAVRRYATVQALVENQRKRVVALSRFPRAGRQAAEVLAVYEETLEILRHALEFERFKHGAGDKPERIPANDPH